MLSAVWFELGCRTTGYNVCGDICGNICLVVFSSSRSDCGTEADREV